MLHVTIIFDLTRSESSSVDLLPFVLQELLIPLISNEDEQSDCFQGRQKAELITLESFMDDENLALQYSRPFIISKVGLPKSSLPVMKECLRNILAIGVTIVTRITTTFPMYL